MLSPVNLCDLRYITSLKTTDTDPGLCPMDPDPAFFVLDLQDASKNYFFLSFSAYYLLKVPWYIYITFLR